MSNFLFREQWRAKIYYDRYFNLEDVKGYANQFAQLNNNKLTTFKFNMQFSENENIAYVNYMEKVLHRITKYKMFYPLVGHDMPREEVKREEGELCDLFVREMRRKPFTKGGKKMAVEEDEDDD